MRTAEDNTASLTLEVKRLRKAVSRLKKLTRKYQHADTIQNALLNISSIATYAHSLDNFYHEMHQYLKKLIAADNFFIITVNSHSGELEVPFFAGMQEVNPASLPPEQPLPSFLQQGPVGYVLKTEEKLLCDKQLAKQLLIAGEISRTPLSHIWLGVPIKSKGTTTGVLVVETYNTRIQFDAIALDLMTFISEHITSVMNRLKYQQKLEDSIQIHTHELEQTHNSLKQEIYHKCQAEQLQKSLYDIAALAHCSTDDLNFYQQLHIIIRQLIPANNCYIALLDETGTQLEFPFYISELNSSAPITRPVQNGLTEYLLKHQHPLLLHQSDISKLSQAGIINTQEPTLTSDHKMHQWVGVPLFIHEKIRGSLTIYSVSEAHCYQNKDLELLIFVSQHIATAIEKRLTAETLRRNYAELEQQVAERTQELAKLNQDLEQEVIQRRDIEIKLLYDIKHDALTGLPNRTMLMERLDHAIKHINRHKLDKFALLFIDLDNFKKINDTLGHLHGDKFLIEATQRMQSCIRENDTLARLGGDEFVILLDCINHLDDAKEVAERIIKRIAKPFNIGSSKCTSSASIGICISSQHNLTHSETMISYADTAMYQAKSNGKGCYAIFDENTGISTQSFALQHEFKQALHQRQLQICYLPVVDLKTGKVQALECRLYWKHPQQGIIEHGQLTLLAEQTNLKIAFDLYLINALPKTRKQLISEHADLHIILSSQHLKHKHALSSLVNTLEETQLPLTGLWLFFNEKALIQETKNHINGFVVLQKLGIKIGVSHYGSGYSTLNSLLFLPIKGLKVDANISKELPEDQQIKLMNAYQKTAATLELETFVDGVNHINQVQIIHSLGYQFGQGDALGQVIYGTEPLRPIYA